MAILNLVFRALGVPNVIGYLPLNATLQEVHERTSDITDYPIEGGSFIQDHIQRKPRRVTMEGYVTDTPLTGFSLGTQGAYEILQLLWRTGVPFTVVSGLEIYTSMAFESLSLPKTREGALRFTATMKEITSTSTTSVQVAGTKKTDPALKKGNVSDPKTQASGVSAGRQSTSAVDPATVTAGTGSASSGSLLSRVF